MGRKINLSLQMHNALYYLYEHHKLIIVNICDTRTFNYTI